MRQPARPGLRRLHLRRSSRRHEPAPPRARTRQDLLLRRLGTFFGQAYAVRHPGTLRGLILDSAYPGDDPYYRTLLPAGRDGLRIACRRSPTCAGDPVARLARVVHAFHEAGRSTEPLIEFLLETGTLAPRSFLSLDEGDRRFLAGDPRRLHRLLAPAPAGEKLSEYSNGLAIARGPRGEFGRRAGCRRRSRATGTPRAPSRPWSPPGRSTT